jgi:hypothetical protein
MLCHPSSVDCSAAPSLALLQDHHMLPAVVVDGVDISTGLNAHSTPRSSGREAVHLRHVDEFPSVELESGLCAQCLEMHFGTWVVEGAELLHFRVARVQWHRCWISIDDEAVVHVWFLWSKSELFVGFYTWVRLECACWDGSIIDDLVEVRRQHRLRSFQSRLVADIEVAGRRYKYTRTDI